LIFLYICVYYYYYYYYYYLAEAEQNKDLKAIDNILKNVIFIPQFVEALSEVLIFKYLSFSENELSNWEFSPETFVCDEDTPSCESQLRVNNNLNKNI